MEKDKVYREYIERIKGAEVPLDAERMFGRIGERIGRRRQMNGLTLAGALVLIMVGILSYSFGRAYFPASGVTVSEYVFQQNESNPDSVINYVVAER
ncbi:MAG TPA: hypothetical protein VMD02_07095 [Candidatus Omnitrophota bacterium]|nr:hypothetical protein [Candidatus Omnitrophota bacterium]